MIGKRSTAAGEDKVQGGLVARGSSNQEPPNYGIAVYSHRIQINCGGYSCALVANSGSMESPQALPPLQRVGR